MFLVDTMGLMKQSKNIAIMLERLGRVLQNEAHTCGLKPTQWDALRYLLRANQFSRNPTTLTSYLGMTKGTVSQTLNALERKGFITKETDLHDRRTVSLELSATGRAVLEKDPMNTLVQSIEGLAEPERRTLLDNLNDILLSLLQKRGGRPFGICNACRFFQPHASDGKPHRCALLSVVLSEEECKQICAEYEAAA